MCDCLCENPPCSCNLHSVTQSTVTSLKLYQSLNTLQTMLHANLATTIPMFIQLLEIFGKL